MSETKRQFFGTDGIRARANIHPLTPDFMVRLGRSAADLFMERRLQTGDWPTVVIGKDTRQSCDMLEAAVSAGIASRGVDVRSAGVIPTPAVAHLTREMGAIFGVVISASHNPFEDNGIKFFGPSGYKLDDNLELELERRVLEDDLAEYNGPVGRCSAIENATERYIASVRESVGNDGDVLKGLTIALDAANGAAFETSEAILHSLGASVKAFHNRPSGLNINDECGCTHPGVIEQIVRDTGADVGVSHDGDADRVLLCDETGSALDGDEMMALAATAMIEAGTLKENTLVATVMSNAGLDQAVRDAGGTVVRAGVGDRYVMEIMRRHGYNLGGEQSGHFIFHDHSTTGDGIVSAVQLLRIVNESGRPLSELRKRMSKFPQAQRNVRVTRKPDISNLAAARIIDDVESALGNAGRVLVRYSGTEPLLRVLVEGREADEIARHADAISKAIADEIGE